MRVRVRVRVRVRARVRVRVSEGVVRGAEGEACGWKGEMERHSAQSNGPVALLRRNAHVTAASKSAESRQGERGDADGREARAWRRT